MQTVYPRLRSLVLGALFLLATPPSRGDPARAGELDVEVQGLQGTEGQLVVGLFATKDGWLSNAKARELRKLPITGARMTLSFPDLPPGRYAVSVVHDANMNGKLDMRWFPFPRPAEGSAVSNNVWPKLGPPGWEECSFAVPAGRQVVTLNLRY